MATDVEAGGQFAVDANTLQVVVFYGSVLVGFDVEAAAGFFEGNGDGLE